MNERTTPEFRQVTEKAVREHVEMYQLGEIPKQLFIDSLTMMIGQDQIGEAMRSMALQDFETGLDL